MPPAEAIQHYLLGAWRMMNGRADGLRMLDLSADGFWTSFYAIAIALPAMLVGWVAVAADFSVLDPDSTRLSLVLRLAMVDLTVWVLPLVALALIAPRLGIAGRFVHFVVASNWSSAIIVWMMLPPALLQLFLPEAEDVATLISLVLFLAAQVFSWRLTNVAIDKGPAMATGVFAGMFIAMLFVLFGMQDLLGLTPSR